ncbi:MAG: CerR family C-terminal domain-containing protein [Phycisphaerae bacterium]|nr:CerR family C-terminal domain-containing protein [Phycisphaerae bacterium]
MDAEATRDKTTEQRLVEAACKLFSKKGFHEATVSEICEEADANVAAVNYYFRSKDNLYVEAWRQAFARGLTAHPPDGGVPPTAPAAERLAGRIRAVIGRICDPVSYEFDMIHHEQAHPTGLLAEITREAIEPLRREMLAVVGELLGPAVPEKTVRLCAVSIMAQCFHMLVHKRSRSHASGARRPGPDLEFDADEIACHITQFSLAAIRELRCDAGDEDGHAT